MSPRLALSLMLAFAACGSSEPTHPSFAPIEAAVAADLARANATAASVAVWLDGEVVWVGGFGHADPAGTAPPDEDTLFGIGSDTKKIAAIALLRQVAAGATTLDATVGTTLPDLHVAMAPGFDATTMRQLLSHQSGIMDGTENTASTTDGALAAYAYGEFAATYHALVAPGRFYNYSNPGFSIAGLATQALDGRMWADIVEDDIFAPLGMTRTFARKAEVDANHALGRGYTVDDQAQVRDVSFAETWEAGFTRPAGHVWSTPSDQMRLAAFLVDGDPAVLDPALRREVTRAQVPMYPELPLGYGFGLMIGRGLTIGEAYYDVPVWAHGGNTLTHTSTFYVLPEQRFAVSILSNGVGDDFTATALAAIRTLAGLPAPGVAPARPFDATQLDGLTGTYVEPYEIGDIAIARAGDGLTIQVPALDAVGVAYDHALVPITTHVWIAVIDGSELEVSFLAGPDGEAYLRHREFVAVRGATNAAAAPRHAGPGDLRQRLRTWRAHEPGPHRFGVH